MVRFRRWLRWMLEGRPRDECGWRYPCAHRAYDRNCNHPGAAQTGDDE